MSALENHYITLKRKDQNVGNIQSICAKQQGRRRRDGVQREETSGFLYWRRHALKNIHQPHTNLHKQHLH